MGLIICIALFGSVSLLAHPVKNDQIVIGEEVTFEQILKENGDTVDE